MTRLLLTLLVLVMLTPSLACAGFMQCCPPTQKSPPSREMPCHDSGKKSSDIKFMKDCAQIDLQGTTAYVFFKKQFSLAHDFFAIPTASQTNPVKDAPVNGIRAPPWDYISSPSPPIYLSTQRLRI